MERLKTKMKSTRTPLLLTLALLALAATGCRSTRTAAPTPAPVAVEEAKPDYTIITFTGVVEGIGVNGQVRMEKGKVIWGSVSKVVELGRAMATTDSIWVRMPLMGRNQEGDYRDLERLSGSRITFGDLEDILLSDNAEERIAALGKKMGLTVQVKITRREKAERLTFPFNK